MQSPGVRILWLETSRSRVDILRCQLNRLFGSGDGEGQTPLEILFTRQLRVYPPTSGTDDHGRLAAFIQPGLHRGATLHALTEKVVEAFARAAFSKKFVTRSDNIERIKFDRDVECLSTAAGW